MKKWKAALAVIPMAAALSFPAFAGEWHLDMNGWWYETDDGSYYRNGWQWIDGNQDGWAECYYFNNQGYVSVRTRQVDGWEVNEDGAWTVDGEIQRKYVPVPGMENDPAAVEADRTAYEKNENLTTADVDANYVMTMEMEGVSLDIGMNMNMKMRGLDGNNLEFLAEGTMTMLGAEIPMTMFYTDGYMYTDAMGEKSRQPMEAMEAVAQANSTVSSGVDMDLSVMRGMRMREENGKTIISFSMDPVMMNSVMNSMMLDMSAYEELGVDASYQLNSCSGEMVINSEGYYESMVLNMDMGMDMSAEGETLHVVYKLNMDMTYNNPGQEVSFTLPSTEGYQDAYYTV